VDILRCDLPKIVGIPELDRQKSKIADIFYYFVVSTHALTGAPFMGGSAVRESSQLATAGPMSIIAKSRNIKAPTLL
jgi:hypothetical protein